MGFQHVRTEARLWYRDREGTEDYTRLLFPVSWDYEVSVDLATGLYPAVVGALSDTRHCASDTDFYFWDDEPGTSFADPDEADYCGSFFFLCDDATNSRFVLNVPALDPALYLPGTNAIEIDRAHPAVAALIAELVRPGPNACINPFGAALVSCDAAYQRYLPQFFPRPTG